MYRFIGYMGMWAFMVFLVTAMGDTFDRIYELNISSQSLNPDCSNFTTPSLIVNGQFPGPTITATTGDRVRLIVRNLLPKSAAVNATNDVTIHIHGIRQYGTARFDGVPFLSQRPIPPGEMLVQEFHVVRQAGTYFYHAHVGLQAQTVYGAFIVYESKEADPSQRVDSPLKAGPYMYDEERLLVLSEWWHWQRVALEEYILGPNPAALPEADSVLFNGRTLYVDNSTDTTDEQDSTCSGGYSVITVDSRKTYRLRVINAGLYRMYAFGIAGHTMTIIEVDGDLIEPYTTEFLDLAPGQRFSILLEANQGVENQDYTIATMKRYSFPVDPASNGLAILRYSSEASVAERVWEVPVGRPTFPGDYDMFHWKWSELRSLSSVLPPRLHGPPSRTITLRSTLLRDENGVRWYVNNVTFVEPEVPILSRILDDRRQGIQEAPPTVEPEIPVLSRLFGDRGQSIKKSPPILEPEIPILSRLLDGQKAPLNVDENGFDSARGTYPVGFLEVVDIVIQTTVQPGGVCAMHPWHTHGHSHWEIAYGEGKYIESEHGHIRNVPHPIHKDVTPVYPPPLTTVDTTQNTTDADCAWSKLRIVTDNPGVWAVHCHNTLHMTGGMMVVFEEAPDLIPDIPVKASYKAT